MTRGPPAPPQIILRVAARVGSSAAALRVAFPGPERAPTCWRLKAAASAASVPSPTGGFGHLPPPKLPGSPEEALAQAASAVREQLKRSGSGGGAGFSKDSEGGRKAVSVELAPADESPRTTVAQVRALLAGLALPSKGGPVSVCFGDIDAAEEALQDLRAAVGDAPDIDVCLVTGEGELSRP